MNEAQTIASEKLAGSHDYFSVRELAELLELHPATIRLWIREGRLPSARKDQRTPQMADPRRRGRTAARREPHAWIRPPARPRGRRELEAPPTPARAHRRRVARALGTGLLERGLS